MRQMTLAVRSKQAGVSPAEFQSIALHSSPWAPFVPVPAAVTSSSSLPAMAQGCQALRGQASLSAFFPLPWPGFSYVDSLLGLLVTHAGHTLSQPHCQQAVVLYHAGCTMLSLVINGYIVLTVRKKPGQPLDPSLSLDKIKRTQREK